MADDKHSYGYRANTPYDRTQRAAPNSAQADPLAELARLIGQQNESAPSYRQHSAPASDYDQGHADQSWSQPQPDPYGQHDGYTGRGYSDAAPSRGYEDARHDPYAGDPRYAQPHYDPSQAYSDPSLAPRSPASGYSDPRYAEPTQDSRHSDPRYVDPHYEASQAYGSGGGYADPRGYADPQGYVDPQGYADSRYGSPAYDGQGYGVQPHAYAKDPSAYNTPAYAGQASPSGFADPYFGTSPSNMHVPAPEDHAPARRRGSIVTVLAVLALAVVGTAAAFGYRAMFGTAGTPVPPPVIRADPRPSKVIPVAGDASGKPIQDRIGGEAERVVSREEAPADPSRSANPRVIFPNLSEQGQKPGASVAANVGPTGSASEPKKIRTVPIKPEQAQASAARNAQASAENAPLALSPNAQQPAAAAPQRQQHASRPATSGAGSPFPAPIGNSASPVTNAISGAYAVQVTSQRSEADAQASYKSLQAQFPAVLGSRQPVIKKADLGDKGTYYRAQIPFASQNEAADFCSSLKSAGGQCVVQKN